MPAMIQDSNIKMGFGSQINGTPASDRGSAVCTSHKLAVQLFKRSPVVSWDSIPVERMQ